MFSDHNGIKVENKTKSQIQPGKSLNICSLNHILINNLWVQRRNQNKNYKVVWTE